MTAPEPTAPAPVCEHLYAWVSPVGTSTSARLCMVCHQPEPEWLNAIAAAAEERARADRAEAELEQSEGEREDLDTAVGTLLGENVELVAERDALAAEVEAGRRLRAGVEALADAGERDGRGNSRELAARLRALLADTDGSES